MGFCVDVFVHGMPRNARTISSSLVWNTKQIDRELKSSFVMDSGLMKRSR